MGGWEEKLTTVLVFDSVVDQYYKPNRTLLINSRDDENEFLAVKTSRSSFILKLLPAVYYLVVS